MMADDSENNSASPETVMKLSEAVVKLSSGVWGGLPLPAPVVALKKSYCKMSVGYGPWRERAWGYLREAVQDGKLKVYIDFPPHPLKLIPINVVNRLITPRGTIPDHAIRPTYRTVDKDAKLLVALINGTLVIRSSDFRDCYLSLREERKWASQRTSLKPRNGRPPKQANKARNMILRMLDANEWDRQAGILELHRMLSASGDVDLPSPDTLARLADQLYRETGNPKLG